MKFLIIIVVLFCSCNIESAQREKKAQKMLADSLAKVKTDSLKTANHIADRNAIAGIFSKKNVNIGDKSRSVIKPTSLAAIVNFEYEFGEYNNYWRSTKAERENKILSVRIKLFSKSKVNGKPEYFFPSLNVFSIDKKNLKSDL